MSWFGFVVVALAAYRVTRVITTDSITTAGRERLYRWAWVEPDEPEMYQLARAKHIDDIVPFAEGQSNPPMPRAGGARTYVNELFNCAWCMGVWVSYAILALWVFAVLDGMAFDRFIVIGAAVAGAQGFVASRYDA